MRYILELLSQPYHWYYAVCIFLALGFWALSIMGISKHIGHSEIGDYGDLSVSNWWQYWGLGAIPLTVSLTLALLFQGVFGIFLNEILLPLAGKQALLRWLILIPVFFVSGTTSLWLTKKASRPLSFLFRDYGIPESANNLVGQIGQVSSGKVTKLLGQASLPGKDGQDIVISIRSEDELNYGDKILLTEFDEEKNIYWVVKSEI